MRGHKITCPANDGNACKCKPVTLFDVYVNGNKIAERVCEEVGRKMVHQHKQDHPDESKHPLDSEIAFHVVDWIRN